jgi:hypothetical protein
VIRDSFGKLFNEGGEIVAEGNCQVDEEHGSVTLRPLIDTPLLSRQQGTLRLALDEGDDIFVSERVIRFRLNVPGTPPGPAYRLFIQGGASQSTGTS